MYIPILIADSFYKNSTMFSEEALKQLTIKDFKKVIYKKEAKNSILAYTNPFKPVDENYSKAKQCINNQYVIINDIVYDDVDKILYAKIDCSTYEDFKKELNNSSFVLEYDSLTKNSKTYSIKNEIKKFKYVSNITNIQVFWQNSLITTESLNRKKGVNASQLTQKRRK